MTCLIAAAVDSDQRRGEELDALAAAESLLRAFPYFATMTLSAAFSITSATTRGLET